MSFDKAMVGIVMGSTSDIDIMKDCSEILRELEIPHEIKVLSAHRTPDAAQNYAASASSRGIEVIIAGAGWAAHLAGAMAANTILPVIGVPINSSPLNGLDALLSTVQMPSGIPVATVALGSGGAKNAGVLAAQILALKYPEIEEKVRKYRKDLTEKAVKNIDVFKQG